MAEAKGGAPIQWFPGHMAKALRQLEERLELVDVVIEVVDARLPLITANPDLEPIIGRRPRLTVLGREDLADPDATRRWLAWYDGHQRAAAAADGRAQPSINRLRPILKRLAGSGPARMLVVGIPNTGKSSLINGLARRAAAKTENRAGVTRGLNWFRVDAQLELMDTPGILVPKIPTHAAQWMLALSGALPRERYDPQAVVGEFAAWAAEALPQRAIPTLEQFAQARGFVRRGGAVDEHNAAGAYLRAFNEGGFGRITFEEPP